MTKAFETWTRKGKRFLAIPRGDGEAAIVLDELGNNYGAWYSAQSFRRAAAGKNPKMDARLANEPLGKVYLVAHQARE